MKSFIDITFSNSVMLDIFGHYMENSVLASFVSECGEINFKFSIDVDAETPQSCEQFLGVFYSLLEGDNGTSAGQAYCDNMTAILKETVYRIKNVLDGFTDIKMLILTKDKSEEGESEKRSEFTFTRRKS